MAVSHDRDEKFANPFDGQQIAHVQKGSQSISHGRVGEEAAITAGHVAKERRDHAERHVGNEVVKHLGRRSLGVAARLR